MKIYSDSAVSKADLSAQLSAHLATIDEKQNRQIIQLRWTIGASFVLNVLLALALRCL